MGGVNLVCRVSISGPLWLNSLIETKLLLQYGGLDTLLLGLESYLEISRIVDFEMGSQISNVSGALAAPARAL